MNTSLLVFLGVAFLAGFPNEVVAKSALGIINGTTAADGEFPYMVQVRTEDSSFYCGGTIIGPEWILTAGQCVFSGNISIVYGSNKLYYGEGDDNYTTIRVKNWFQHPNFQYNFDMIPLYDVGILQLETPIPFSETAQPLPIAEANSAIPFHVQGVLSGWGSKKPFSSVEPYLRKIYLPLLTDEECTKKINDYSKKFSFNSTHNLCSDDYHSGQCNGDAGSPYVINGTQYGIASWSFKPCGIVPGAYSRITNPEYRNWIKNITNI